MFQNQGYYQQNLGTAGHRATSSYNYMQQYTPNYYNGRASHPMFTSYPAVQVPYVQQQMICPPPVQQIHSQHMQQDAAVNGGIDSVLEYDSNNMATFLSWCAFGMLKQNKNPSKDFENLIVSVLLATRLPTSTIIIALEYMNQRFSSVKFSELSESDIFFKLIIALVLGNKFNDDNTFTNKSWSGATGLSVDLLNKEERTWLEEVEWKLNVVNYEANIKTLEECWKTWLEKYGTQTHTPTPGCTPKYPVSSNPYVKYAPQQQSNQYSSIPSSPMYRDNFSSSPITSSPIRYSYDTIWSRSGSTSNTLWSHTPNFHYIPNGKSGYSNDHFVQYKEMPGNYVGYANPYMGYNMASC